MLMHTTAWMSFKGLLGERRQAQKCSDCVIPFVQNVQKRQIYSDKKQSRGCVGLGQV